jgi:hypothetical protein
VNEVDAEKEEAEKEKLEGRQKGGGLYRYQTMIECRFACATGPLSTKLVRRRRFIQLREGVRGTAV